MPMTDAEKAALLQEAVAADLAEKAGSYAPADGPAPSLTWDPIVKPDGRVTVSTDKYLSPTTGGFKGATLSGTDALPLLDEDMAARGLKRESVDSVSKTATYVKDEDYAFEAQKRRLYEGYRQEWSRRSLLKNDDPAHINGAPHAPKVWEYLVASGADVFPERYVAPEPSPEEVLERRIRALEAQLPRLPR
jgi:hypothetical protein